MRLRMKVWTDPMGKRYLMPAAFMIPGSQLPLMKAYAMSDDDTLMVNISMQEWDKLPFFYFKEDGEVSKEERPRRKLDVIGAT